MYIVYETKNKINGKIYIGIHNNENDKYLGSGKYLKEAINFYGKEAFERKTLFKCKSLDEAQIIEASIVNDTFIKREDTYNIVLGGGVPPQHIGEQHPNFGKKLEWASKRMKTNNPVYLPHVMQYNRSTINVRDQTGKCFRVANNDPRYLSGELIHNSKGIESKLKNKPRKLVTCIHCNKTGAEGNMHRWHFENCKMKGAVEK